MRTRPMMFATVGVLLLYLVGLSVCDQCDTARGVDGCSIPWDMPYFYKDVFKSDCNKHDVCYACGQHYGVDRTVCDQNFYANVLRTCFSDARVDQVLWCIVVSYNYYKAVDTFGEDHYEDVSPDWCSQSWVLQCLL